MTHEPRRGEPGDDHIWDRWPDSTKPPRLPALGFFCVAFVLTLVFVGVGEMTEDRGEHYGTAVALAALLGLLLVWYGGVLAADWLMRRWRRSG